MRGIRRLCSIVVVLLTLAPRAWAGAPVLVVETLAPIGVSASLAEDLTTRLRVELERLGGFEVVSPSEMNTLAQSLGLGADACGERQCAEELAKMVNADLLVTGRVGKEEAGLRVRARIVNLSDGSVKTETEVRCGTGTDALRAAAADLARKLAEP